MHLKFLRYSKDSRENDHDGYDYAEFPTQSQSGQTKGNSRFSLNDKETSTLKKVQNPYYGGDDDADESESCIADKAKRNSLRQDIKVTENPYYD